MSLFECFQLCIFILVFDVNDLMIYNSGVSQYGFRLALHVYKGLEQLKYCVIQGSTTQGILSLEKGLASFC